MDWQRVEKGTIHPQGMPLLARKQCSYCSARALLAGKQWHTPLFNRLFGDCQARQGGGH
jgi:hypothetical protein